MGTTDFFQSIGRIIKKTTIYIFFAIVFGIIIFVKGILTTKETVVKWQRKSSL